ncbi:uncharacterized protein LOC115699843 [Cannabis sativa]|uniref:uncharacterized protein LOC115699843 n=1 Tax=Cannabis sativa TaxID=3483 RepID=UPI0029CA2AA6|nr:uncharacterized protein LOC115699843 [Cannabis sativa]
MRSMLKRARAGDVDVSGSSSIPDDEQAGDAEHTRHPPGKMSLICWNARGLGNPRAFNWLSDMIKSHKPVLIFLMETRLKPNLVDRFKALLGFDFGLEISRQYFGGGLLLLWKADISKHFTWKLLHDIYYNASHLPWLIMGDFNSYLFSTDKLGGQASDQVVMSIFSDFINKFSMFPLPYVGCKYTWTNKTISERLDWAVASESWCDLFPENSLHHLGYYECDHRALKLLLANDASRPINLLIGGSVLKIEIENFQNQDVLTQADRLHLNKLNSMLDALLYKEEVYSKQRARVRWLNAGDKNTKFFHKQATIRKKTNAIKYLKDNEGNVVNSQEGIANLVISHFSDLFSTQGCNVDAAAAIFDALGPGLEIPDVEFLEQDFTAEEVKKAVFQLLKRILDKIISPFQSAFISGRGIFDNIIIANELVHAINNRKFGKKGWAALKLDMAKAFDRVEWNFLCNIMFHFNFPVRFVSLILKCLSSASISFSINGSVHGNVKPTRGIRHGDPLSPYLFILCAEGLSAILRNYHHRGLLHGISISRNAPPISHLLFADDSILFCAADRNSCHALQQALSLYSQALGQMINFTKSSILFSPNTQNDIRDLFLRTFQLKDKPFITKYLGLPQCLSRAKYQSFTFLKDKVSSIIHSWHHKWFSKAGKETLIKAVLQAIPSYAMSCFRIPTRICREIESLISKFWWGSSPEVRKVHWKNWRMVCQSKFVGGLGFRSLIHFNQAMLAKQAWRVFKCPDSLLSLVLKARYFPNSSILDAGPGHSPSYTWRSILWGRDLMKQGLIWKVGDGSTIRTIEDHWLPNCRVKSYSSPPPSDSTLSFLLSPSGAWDPIKLHQFFDDQLVDHILNFPISGHGCSDDLIWSRNSSGLFTVKSVYHLAVTSSDIPSSSSFDQSKRFWSKIWSFSVPSKVKHLVWHVLSNSAPVASLLFLRHIIPSPICPLCHLKWETVEHALLECNEQVQLSQHEGWKVNTDAGVSNSVRKHSLGVVVTNENDDIKAGLIIPIVGSVPPEVAEAKAILTAISWVQATKLLVNVLQTDCKSIVDKVYNTKCHNSVVNDIVTCIKNSLLFSPNLVIVHVPRELNKIAHVCARVQYTVVKF